MLQTEIRRQPKAFITENELRVIQTKQYLTLKEAAVLLNVSPLTLRKWALVSMINAHKVGKKWMFEKNVVFLKSQETI